MVLTHLAECCSVGLNFYYPLATKTLRGWSEELYKLVGSIGCMQGQRLDINTSDSTRHLTQKISISSWKGDANMWLSGCPVHPASVDSLIWPLFFSFMQSHLFLSLIFVLFQISKIHNTFLKVQFSTSILKSNFKIFTCTCIIVYRYYMCCTCN